MATKITVALEDDLDGGPADETVRFGRGGTEYEIDLNRENAWAFRKQLAPCAEHARKTALGAGADRIKPSAQRRHPGLGERQGYRGRRPRAHPRHVVEQYQPPPKDPDAHPDHRRHEPIRSARTDRLRSESRLLAVLRDSPAAAIYARHLRMVSTL
jgi:Lsr2